MCKLNENRQMNIYEILEKMNEIDLNLDKLEDKEKLEYINSEDVTNFLSILNSSYYLENVYIPKQSIISKISTFVMAQLDVDYIIKNFDLLIRIDSYFTRKLRKKVMNIVSDEEKNRILDALDSYIEKEIEESKTKDVVRCMVEEIVVLIEEYFSLNKSLDYVTKYIHYLTTKFQDIKSNESYFAINRAFLSIKFEDTNAIKYYIQNFYNYLTPDNKEIAKQIGQI